MSVSKVHISKYTGAAAENILKLVSCDSLGGGNLNAFCIKFVAGLNSGLCNDYTMIWDNYSVGGDQIDYTYKILSSASKIHGRIFSSSWKITFGFGFKTTFPVGIREEPAGKIHRMIFFNTFKATLLGADDLIVCIEEVLGPTIHDVELNEIQQKFISELETDH